MTITAIKKENFKRTIELLINKYKAYDIDNEGAHIHMLIDFENNTIPCELSRDCMFESWDPLELGGNGWSDEEINTHKSSTKIVDIIIQDIKKINLK